MSRHALAAPARRTRARLLIAIGLGAVLFAGCSADAAPETETAVPDVGDAIGDAPAGFEELDLEDVDLDALFGNTTPLTGSRLLGIEACAEIEDVVAPIRAPQLQPSIDEVQNYGYPRPGPYVYRCGWADPEDRTMSISVHGSGDWDGETREEILAPRDGDREIAPQVVDTELHSNLVLLASQENTAYRGMYILYVASPVAPNSAITGWVSVRYSFGSETGAPKAEVPSDQVMTEVLLGLVEDASDD